MKIMGVSLLFTALLGASQIEYGTGNFTLTGGFLGLENSIDTDISTFSLVERHSNIASDFFYSYDLTWYDSKILNQAQHTYNDLASNGNDFLGLNNDAMNIPSMEHQVKGLDANVRVGYDVIHQDEDNFLALGMLVGISIPWIESSKSASSENDISVPLGSFEESKTKIMTYKIGPSFNFQKSLIADKLSVYGLGSYAYQTGSLKNDYADSKLTVNGIFQEYNLGLYYTPFTQTYKWGWVTLSPRVYATLGYKYSKWDVDEVLIDISGMKQSSSVLDPLATKFSMQSSVTYMGLGYSF